MWVVKIGGSLLGAPELAHWLALFVKFSDGKVIIVPGGGLFADAVREAQKLSNISDAVAHKLALLAMDQFGLLLAGMNPGLAIASSELEIAERGWQHKAIVWLPSKMVLADDSLPQNWQVSADSLSAWLANKTGAEHLVLLKSKLLDKGPMQSSVSLKDLAESQLLDSEFKNFVIEQPYQTWLLNKADYALFEQGITVQNVRKNGLLIQA